MARAVNVILQIKDGDTYREFDVNSIGLVECTFKRYMGDTKSQEQVLSQLDITAFDYTGYKLLSMVQANSGNIRIKYGFNDDMSGVYVLTVNKMNAIYNDLGVMVSLGAYGQYVKKTSPAEYYKRGTDIESIIKTMARRNNWYIGEDESHVNCNGLKLAWDLFKKASSDDYTFIKEKILPMCIRTVSNSARNSTTEYWDMRIFNSGSFVEFYFLPYNERVLTKRVWSYSYGATTDSSVIELTNSIDYSFLIKGLTIQVPALPSEYALKTNEENQKYYNNMIFTNMWDYIVNTLNKYHLPIPSKETFVFNIEFIDIEDLGDMPIEYRILNSIKNVIQRIATIDLEVIGNPRILPTDLIDLVVKNNDGYNNIITGRWKVVTITESIGLNGFSTKLGLVRDNIDISLSDETLEDFAKVKKDHGFVI